MPQPRQSNLCVAVTFSSDAIISSLSAGAEQWSGYAARDLVGRPVTHLLADHSTFEFHKILKTAADWGLWEGDLVLLDRSGMQTRTQGIISPLTGYGQPGFLMVSALRGRQELSDEELYVLEEAGHRLRVLSHEMNNPLAVMMGFLQLMMLNPQCTGRLRSDLEKLHSEMNRLVHVVERLHQYAISLRQGQGDQLLDSLTG